MDANTNMRYPEIYGPEWMSSLPTDLISKLHHGDSIVLGNKIYQVCSDCRQVVRINKPLLGSMHICSED
jgi:hypothetical protein